MRLRSVSFPAPFVPRIKQPALVLEGIAEGIEGSKQVMRLMRAKRARPGDIACPQEDGISEDREMLLRDGSSE
jgi:hypothetical protein